MLQKALLLIPLLFVFSPELLATGPSYIKAGIKPISINDKGEVLCRTRFLKNPSGGHYVLDIEYGLCVLTGDTILQFPIDTVSFEYVAYLFPTILEISSLLKIPSLTHTMAKISI